MGHGMHNHCEMHSHRCLQHVLIVLLKGHCLPVSGKWNPRDLKQPKQMSRKSELMSNVFGGNGYNLSILLNTIASLTMWQRCLQYLVVRCAGRNWAGWQGSFCMDTWAVWPKHTGKTAWVNCMMLLIVDALKYSDFSINCLCLQIKRLVCGHISL